MSVSVKGVDEILKNLEAKLGPARTNRIVNKSLRNYGEKLQQDVQEAVSSYMDTGETHDNSNCFRSKKMDRLKRSKLVGVKVQDGA